MVRPVKLVISRGRAARLRGRPAIACANRGHVPAPTHHISRRQRRQSAFGTSVASDWGTGVVLAASGFRAARRNRTAGGEHLIMSPVEFSLTRRRFGTLGFGAVGAAAMATALG